MSARSFTNAEPLEWPLERTVVLTLDLECDYGTAIGTNTYGAARHTPDLVAFLESVDVPLSCFLQTEVLDVVPEAVRALESAAVTVDFHAHSHTHDRLDRSNAERQVEASVERVRERFSDPPVGYRYPDGAIPNDGYRLLADHDVPFSSSLFPSWRPGRFNNLTEPTRPFSPDGAVIELPLTPLSPTVRIPVSLSYLKLFGRPFVALVERVPPSVIVFDLHMHDLVTPEAFSDLPRPYRAVYRRNRDRGFRALTRFVDAMSRRGYRFATMTDLYDELADARATDLSRS